MLDKKCLPVCFVLQLDQQAVRDKSDSDWGTEKFKINIAIKRDPEGPL